MQGTPIFLAENQWLWGPYKWPYKRVSVGRFHPYFYFPNWFFGPPCTKLFFEFYSLIYPPLWWVQQQQQPAICIHLRGEELPTSVGKPGELLCFSLILLFLMWTMKRPWLFRVFVGDEIRNWNSEFSQPKIQYKTLQAYGRFSMSTGFRRFFHRQYFRGWLFFHPVRIVGPSRPSLKKIYRYPCL